MTRTLFIGLDGATFTVLDSLVDAADPDPAMPFLGRLIRNGVKAKLRSTPNPLTPPAWVSIMTGRMPGHHGVFDFLHAEERDGDVFFTLTDSRHIRTETIWSIAGRQGLRVAALNFPMTAPPRAVSGAVVPGFVPWKHLRRNVSPPGLFERLKTIPGFAPEALAWDFEKEKQAMEEFCAEEIEEWVRYHTAREEQWFRIAEKLMVEDSPDLMAVMFDGTDKIQHQAWRFLLPELSRAEDSKSGRSVISLCRDYFRRLDSCIERLVRIAGPRARVFMASDHGFTTSVEIVRINAILHDLGHLFWRSSDRTAQESRREKSWFANLDWKRTVAYCRTPSSNGITIRRACSAGEPGVAPAEYESFRNRLIEQLLKVRDDLSGEAIFRGIHKREDVFAGEAMHDAPDLLVELRDHGFMSIANARPAIEKRARPAGTHHPDGIFLAYGNGLRSGLSAEPRSIVDVTATLLYSLGLPVPRDIEGMVPLHFFEEDFIRLNPLRAGEPTRTDVSGEARSEDVDAAIKEKLIVQLRMLGYME